MIAYRIKYIEKQGVETITGEMYKDGYFVSSGGPWSTTYDRIDRDIFLDKDAARNAAAAKLARLLQSIDRRRARVEKRLNGLLAENG